MNDHDRGKGEAVDRLSAGFIFISRRMNTVGEGFHGERFCYHKPNCIIFITPAKAGIYYRFKSLTNKMCI
jgi:hypothetical protein